MLTIQPTPEQISAWKQLFARYRDQLRPNRKSGAEVDAYFRAHYSHTAYPDAAFAEIVRLNILENKPLAEKLPAGMQPEIRTYLCDGVCVGIDLVTGFFHIECEDIARVIPVWDDLFAFRGLDENDLQNFYLVAEYVQLCKKLHER